MNKAYKAQRKYLKKCIEALKKERHRIAVDANLHDFFHANYPCAINSSNRRKEINEAIEYFQKILEDET